MKRLKASLAAVMFFLCLSAEAEVLERIVAVSQRWR